MINPTDAIPKIHFRGLASGGAGLVEVPKAERGKEENDGFEALYSLLVSLLEFKRGKLQVPEVMLGKRMPTRDNQDVHE